MWFDNPIPSFNKSHAMDLKLLVRCFQSGCLISSRIGHGLGDIRGFGDNYIPAEKTNSISEACLTMNDTWGYKKDGGRWKSIEEILAIKKQTLTNKCNLLLNVGPMANGSFPPEAISRLNSLQNIPLQK